MQEITIETRKQRRERLYGPATGRPNKRLCPVLPTASAERAAPRLWDVCTALRLWNGGLFGDWREFNYRRLRRELVRPCLPYRN
jgi:hypothetical protein